MAMYTPDNSGGPILSPEDVGALLVRPALNFAVAENVTTIVTTSSHDYRIPIVAEDPSAAWVAEGDEITPDDMDLSEVTVTPAKVAGLTIISRELAEDTDPAAAQIVGTGLARDIARKVDAAFFGGLPLPAPAGLESLTTATVTGTFTNTDPFAEAISVAEQAGAVITGFVTDPATALTLAQVKDEDGSQRPLLGTDPSQPTRRLIAGVPLHVSPAVTPGTVWGIPRDRTYLVVRDGARIEVDRSVYFTSDRVAVRATMRAGFGYPHPAAVVKITAAS